ncbi:MAG: hypothetical protein PWP23_3153 [Candidatus Sumerlaeota bacterium]|nr:hypothetical protein [Candidatus Sumerlaeota bacterium]
MTTAESFPLGMRGIQANPNRELAISFYGERWLRLPVQTHILTDQDDLLEAIGRYAMPLAQKGDVLFLSEKAVAVTQGRAIPEDQLKIGLTARILWRFVSKVPYGIGLRRPSSMQCAVDECGALRIWAAAIIGGTTRLLGRRGDFYRLAGPQAAMIDAASTSPLQPHCVIMGPKDPDKVASRIQGEFGIATAIVDVNDVGGSWVVGASADVDRKLMEACLRDNPLGQGTECTPMGLLRREG